MMNKLLRFIIEKNLSDLTLAELDFEKPSQIAGDRFPLLADLRVGYIDICEEDISFRLGIKELHLTFDFNKCRVVPGTRYGDLDIQASRLSETTVKVDSEREAAFGAQGEGGFSGKLPTLKASLTGNARSSTKRVERTELTLKKEFREVSAEPYRWTFRVSPEDDKSFLDGNYLKPREALCEMEITARGFSLTANLFFNASSRNLYLDNIACVDNGIFRILADKFSNQRNRNRERAFQLLASRALKRNGLHLYISVHHIKPVWEGGEDDAEEA
jgi:hypothetical protein